MEFAEGEVEGEGEEKAVAAAEAWRGVMRGGVLLPSSEGGANSVFVISAFRLESRRGPSLELTCLEVKEEGEEDEEE